VCALLSYFGVKAAHVDGATGSQRRSAILQAFKSGDIQVICNFGILTTGFDAPQIDVVFISRPTTSIVLYSQMIGRGLRGPKLGGTAGCRLIDVRDNIEGFAGNDLYEYFEEYWTHD
jgi:DNA repair protein RadD